MWLAVTGEEHVSEGASDWVEKQVDRIQWVVQALEIVEAVLSAEMVEAVHD